jgi:hypothetical protein
MTTDIVHFRVFSLDYAYVWYDGEFEVRTRRSHNTGRHVQLYPRRHPSLALCELDDLEIPRAAVMAWAKEIDIILRYRVNKRIS